MNIISVENLSFAYERNGVGDYQENVLKDVSFNVEEGEIIAIAGLSGCGKSTLCQIICGIIPHCFDGIMTGKVNVMGIEPWREPLSRFACLAGYVMQDCDRQIIATTVEDELAFAPENLCMSPERIRVAIDEVLQILGIENLKYRNPSELSGGEKQLVAIGGVLTLNPKILILDEPMSHLDKESRTRLEDVLIRLNKAGKTIIIIEHNTRCMRIANKILVLKDGTVAAYDSAPNIIDRIDSIWR